MYFLSALGLIVRRVLDNYNGTVGVDDSEEVEEA